MTEIKAFVTLEKLKIPSVNNIYKAGLLYKNGRPVPYIYKDQNAKHVTEIIHEGLRSITWDETTLDFLRNTPYFDVTEQFILKSGANRRDTANLEKLTSDSIVSFFRDELGITTFDDSKFSSVYLKKNYIPKGQNEYICINIREAPIKSLKFELDQDKPGKIYLHPMSRIEGLPEIKGLCEDWDSCDTDLYILDPGDAQYWNKEKCLNLSTSIMWSVYMQKQTIIEVLGGLYDGYNGWEQGIYEALRNLLRKATRISSKVKVIYNDTGIPELYDFDPKHIELLKTLGQLTDN